MRGLVLILCICVGLARCKDNKNATTSQPTKAIEAYNITDSTKNGETIGVKELSTNQQGERAQVSFAIENGSSKALVIN